MVGNSIRTIKHTAVGAASGQKHLSANCHSLRRYQWERSALLLSVYFQFLLSSCIWILTASERTFGQGLYSCSHIFSFRQV